MGRRKYLAERTNTSGSHVAQIKLQHKHMWLHKNHRNPQAAKAPAHPTSDRGMETPSAETTLGRRQGHGFPRQSQPQRLRPEGREQDGVGKNPFSGVMWGPVLHVSLL